MFSFLHNVRENSAQHGLHHIQKELLSKTIGFDVNLRDVSEGIPIIKERKATPKEGFVSKLPSSILMIQNL
jgi:hypothetical protein